MPGIDYSSLPDKAKQKIDYSGLPDKLTPESGGYLKEVGDRIVGAGEAALNVGSKLFWGALSPAVALKASLEPGVSGPEAWKRAGEAVHTLTYKPVTKEGKRQAEILNTPIDLVMGPLSEGVEMIGQAAGTHPLVPDFLKPTADVIAQTAAYGKAFKEGARGSKGAYEKAKDYYEGRRSTIAKEAEIPKEPAIDYSDLPDKDVPNVAERSKVDYSELPDKPRSVNQQSARIDYSELPDKTPTALGVIDNQREPIVTDKIVESPKVNQISTPQESLIVEQPKTDAQQPIAQNKMTVTPSPEPQPIPEGSTGVKRSVVDAEREARGLEPIETVSRSKDPATWDTAKSKVDSGEINPRKLAQDIIDNPRTLSPEEVYALLYDRMRLQNDHARVQSAIEEAQLRGDGAEELRLSEERTKIENAQDTLDNAARINSTSWHDTGEAMQKMIAEDYSLSAILRRARSDKGSDLTPQERAKYEDLARQIEEANNKIREYEERLSNREAEKTVKQIRNRIAKENRNIKRTYEKKELDAEFSSLLADLKNSLGDQRGSFSLREKLGDSAAVILGKMTVNRIKYGYKTAEAIIDSIYTELKNIGIEVSKRELRDIISNYGKTSKPSQEQLHVELREARRQMRLISALEDAQSGKVPLRSGLQRDLPSDRVRELQRQVKQAMKENGIDSSKLRSPEEQWKTALDAIKTRLRNQINDLTKQLETGQKTPKKVGVKYDAEAEALRKIRDDLKVKLEAIEGKSGLSPEQRIRLAEAAVTRSINNLRSEILTGNKANLPKPTVTSPKLDALRKVQSELQKTKQYLNKLSKPTLSPDEIALKTYKTRTAKRIAELERKIQNGDFSVKERKPVRLDKEAQALQYKLDAAKRKYQAARFKDQLARRTFLQKSRDAILEVVNTSRAVITSFDLSAVLRQGGFIVISHPIRGARSLPAMFKAMLSEKGRFAVDNEIRNRPNYKNYQDYGLYLSKHDDVGLAQMEEVYMSRHVEKLPGVGASQRAYTTFLNKLRADSFDIMVEKLSKKKAATPEEMKAIANYINVATGRGNLWMKENALVGLNTIFFAPRLVASRFNLLAGQPLWRGSMRTRKMITKEYARFLIGIGVVYTLAKAMGAEIDFDPRGSDFGKIKIGNTRIDPLSGLSQSTVLVGRVTSGETKTLSGDIKPIRGEDIPYGSGNTADVIGRFLRTKLSPAIGTAVDVVGGKDVVGKPVTAASVTKKALVPMSFSDIYEAMKDQGVAKGAALAILGIFGAGLMTIEAED